MNKNIICACIFFIINLYNSQVNFTNGVGSNINSSDQVIVYINNASEASNIKGFGLPTVNSLADLPYTGSNAPASRIEELRGLLLFVNSTGETMVFDGLVWTKAFNIVGLGSNISRFQINNTVSTTNGQVTLPFSSVTGTYLNDPLKVKTNVPSVAAELPKLYIRQTGTYRVNISLTLTSSESGAFSKRLGIAMFVNGVERTRLLETVTDFNAVTKLVNLDTVLYLKQGEYFTMDTISEVGGAQSFTVSDNTFVTIEKIL
ncbi:hypothetical protein [Chryseobacterium defluvii]|uniref:C1q domain-containing protein n=1 Tax=Chryseobacterium defluvii TaxID=160396 RepID=A0A495SDI5_9FLAO|nr:hypothetical protein [Chryseobacterium defluvii]RKS97936.1 hypothetical protein BCF58_2070 [Chryseobacterium defluvii]